MVAALQPRLWPIQITTTESTFAPEIEPVTAKTFERKSDEELMTYVSQGSTPALEALYNRHVRNCFGLAMKIVRDPHIAEEVVQDIFVKLWSKPGVFVAERGKFSGWLLTLVHNRSVDKLRRASAGLAGLTVTLDNDNNGGVALAEILPDDAPGLDETAWQQERGEILRKAMRNLPLPQRQALSLAYFGGLTQKEIADHLQEPLGTIKTRTRSGLQHLRRLLSGLGIE